MVSRCVIRKLKIHTLTSSSRIVWCLYARVFWWTSTDPVCRKVARIWLTLRLLTPVYIAIVKGSIMVLKRTMIHWTSSTIGFPMKKINDIQRKVQWWHDMRVWQSYAWTLLSSLPYYQPSADASVPAVERTLGIFPTWIPYMKNIVDDIDQLGGLFCPASLLSWRLHLVDWLLTPTVTLLPPMAHCADGLVSSIDTLSSASLTAYINSLTYSKEP